MIIRGSALSIPLADKSAHSVCTSPPYMGLRCYAGQQECDWPAGVYSPMTGAPVCIEVPGWRDFEEYSNCDHEFIKNNSFFHKGQVPDSKWKNNKIGAEAGNSGGGKVCSKCGTLRCAYGAEPTAEAYVWHTLLMLRECRRVLRDDGVLWWVIGDSFSHSQPGRNRNGLSKIIGTPRMLNYVREGGTNHTGIDSGNLIGIPHRVMLAAQADGWIVRNDLAWVKRAPMPESVKGIRWERHRVKISSQKGAGKQPTNPGSLTAQKGGTDIAEWDYCPGCDKCLPNGGYILRNGSWRHTRAHEMVLMMVKSMSYWADGEIVKEPIQESSIKRLNRAVSNNHKNIGGAPGQSPHTMNQPRPNKRLDKQTTPNFFGGGDSLLAPFDPNGRNPRSVLSPKPFPLKEKHYACVDSETECLTIGGWKRYDQLHEGMPIFTYNISENYLEIQRIKRVNLHEYSGNLISVFGRNSNMLMTSDHKCVVRRYLSRRRKPGETIFVNADDLKEQMTFPVAAKTRMNFTIQNEPIEFFELLGWILSEGNFGDEGEVELSQSLTANPERVNRIEFLLGELGEYTRKENNRKDKGIIISWNLHGELRKKVRLYVPDKFRVPEHFLVLPNDCLISFLNGFVGGDGHIREDGRISIKQKGKNVLDMIQAMYIRLGKSCVLSQRGFGMWTAFISNKTWRHFKNSSSSLIRNDYVYHGIVWCPTTDNGTWVARRGGRPFITGNSYPPSLIEPLVLASTPAECCSKCGKGWAAVVEKTGERQVRWSKISNGPYRERNTVDEFYVSNYRPSCSCNAEPRPGICLDPFFGSGTTGLVARYHHLNFIGIEISAEYVEIAKRRIARTDEIMKKVKGKKKTKPNPKKELMQESML